MNWFVIYDALKRGEKYSLTVGKIFLIASLPLDGECPVVVERGEGEFIASC